MIAEYSVGGNGAESSPAARQYVNGTQHIDERVAMVDAGSVDHYYLLEELYRVAGRAASNGTLEEAVVSDTYGEAKIHQWPAADGKGKGGSTQ